MLLDAAVGWTLFLGLILAIGAVGGRFAIFPFVAGSDALLDDGLRREARRLGMGGAILAMVGMVGVFVRQFLEFRDPFGAFTEDLALLLRTPWTRTWLLGVAAVALLLFSFRIAKRSTAVGWPLAALSVLWASTFPALSGHAASAPENRWLSIAADSVHVLAAGAWIGGLALVLWLERHRSRLGGPNEGSLLPTLMPAFSRVAMAAVGLLVVTGAVGSFRELNQLSDLWVSSYGRLLLAKLGLVGLVLGLGGLNWRRLTPTLATGSGQLNMRRAATVEFLLANLVLLVTSLLVRTSPLGP